MRNLTRLAAALAVMLALPLPSFAQTVNAPTYRNPAGQVVAAQGVTCINPSTRNPESCAGSGGGGGGDATAANQVTGNNSLATIATNTGQEVANNPADNLTYTDSVSSAAVGRTFSTAGYGSVSFQVIANASANSVTLEGSNDGGTTWSALALRPLASTGSGGATTTFTGGATASYTPTAVMPQMRWRVSTFVGGTTTVAIGLKRNSTPNIVDAFVGNTVLTQGPVATGSAPSGNPVFNGCRARNTNPGAGSNETVAPVLCDLIGRPFMAIGSPASEAPVANFGGDVSGAQNSLLVTSRGVNFDPVTLQWKQARGDTQGTWTVDQNIAQSAVFTAQSAITRPADTTAYTGVTGSTQGDLVANSTTAGSVTPFTFAIPAVNGTGTAEGYVTGVSVRESGRKARHTFRVHLFQTTAPTVTNGDNGAAAVSNYSGATYLCYVDVVMDPSIGGQLGMSDDTLCPYSKTSAGTIYALLEAYDGYTPANAETIGVSLYANRTR